MLSRLNMKLLLTILAVVIVFVGGIIMYLRISGRSSGGTERTEATLATIRLLQPALVAYVHAHQSYPRTAAACAPLGSVVPELVAGGFLQKDITTFLAGSYPINIGVSSDALQYVIESEGNGFKQSPVTATDVDGQVFGCNCDDPNYCVTDEK